MHRPRLLQTENACWVSSLSLVLAVAFAPRLSGATVITGDVTPALPWSGSTTPHIGITGAGTLAVDEGSQLFTDLADLGIYSGSTGTATITGAGSKWTNKSSFRVGGSGNGAIRVDGGAQVNGFYVFLGVSNGSTGAATITGAGSTWSNYNDLYVGHSGSGSLRVEAGGQVWNNRAELGHYPGSTGAATITGAGSTWTNSFVLYVGGYGSGELRVEAGGQVSNTSANLGSFTGSTGTATITGAGSAWTNSALSVGYAGSGALTVEAGGQVSSLGGYVGQQTGSTGIVTITGAGSKWTNSIVLKVGDLGSGTLTVKDGGHVTAATLYTSLGDLHGDGTIAATAGAVLDADLLFNAAHPAQAVLGFGSGGALTVTAAGGDLGAGYRGFGSLTIAEGVSISSSSGYVGYHPGSTGTATITGGGSKLTHSDELYVGYSGSGALRVEAGGHVRSNDCRYLGFNPGSTGTATITGAGSQWTGNLEFYIGYSGSGELRVEAGGHVSSFTGSLGSSTGSTGTATITGAGSTWTNISALYVGNSGSGELRVKAGGQASNGFGFLGYNAGSTGRATVTGAGCTWTNSGDLTVGQLGRGELIVTAGGLVSVRGRLKIDTNGGGDSFINMATGGMLALWGNADDSLAQFLGFNGTGAIRYWNASLADWSPLTAGALGVDYALQYLDAGDLAGYTLLTVGTLPPAGDFNLDGRVDGADLLAWQRGNSPTPNSAEDLATWKANFGLGAATPATTAVPEPGTFALVGLASLSVFLGSGRRAAVRAH